MTDEIKAKCLGFNGIAGIDNLAEAIANSPLSYLVLTLLSILMPMTIDQDVKI